MNKQLGKLLAAVLLLACLPVGAQGTESSQETIPARGSIFEGTVVDMSIWAEAEGGSLSRGRVLPANQCRGGSTDSLGRRMVGKHALESDEHSRVSAIPQCSVQRLLSAGSECTENQRQMGNHRIFPQ